MAVGRPDVGHCLVHAAGRNVLPAYPSQAVSHSMAASVFHEGAHPYESHLRPGLRALVAGWTNLDRVSSLVSGNISHWLACDAPQVVGAGPLGLVSPPAARDILARRSAHRSDIGRTDFHNRGPRPNPRRVELVYLRFLQWTWSSIAPGDDSAHLCSCWWRTSLPRPKGIHSAPVEHAGLQPFGLSDSKLGWRTCRLCLECSERVSSPPMVGRGTRSQRLLHVPISS